MSRIRELLAREFRLVEDFAEQGSADVDGMDAEDGGELEDFEDLCFAGAGGEGGGGVGADARDEEVRAGGVDGEEEELLGFAGEFGGVEGDLAKFQVGGEVGGVEGEDVFVGAGPGFAGGEEGGFEVFLFGGKWHFGVVLWKG